MTTTKPSLWNRNFILLFQGQLISEMGSAVYLIAMILWLQQETQSPLMVGILMMCATLPAAIIGPIAGAWVDRLPKVSILVWADSINGILLLFIAWFMWQQPDATTWIIALLLLEALIGGTLKSLFRPAVNSLVPKIVPAGQLATANGLVQITVQLALFIGQSLGGVFFRWLGAMWILLINGLSFLGSAVSEAFIRIPAEEKPVTKTSVWQEVKAGWQFVKKQPGLGDLLFMVALITFFSAPIVVLLPFFVEQQLQAAAPWFGYLIASVAFGGIFGSLIAGALPIKAQHKGKALISIILMLAFAYIGFSVASNVWQALALFILMGVCSGIANVWITTAMQMATPEALRGRVFALLNTIATILAPLAMILTGAVSEWLNNEIQLIYSINGGCIAIICFGLFFRSGISQLLANEQPST